MPYKITDHLDKQDFITLVNAGQTVFYKDWNRTSFTIVVLGEENTFVRTDQNDITISRSIHALWRLFQMWQSGELL